MVMITSSHVVLPRKPTPSNPLELHVLDKKQRFHISLIFVYKQVIEREAAMEALTQKMKESLSHILVYYYPFAGRFRRKESGDLLVDCNAKGAILVEANTESKLTDYGGFAPSKLMEDLVPAVDYSTPIETWPLLLVQLTRFSCGGICVGVTFCHTLVDAWSCFFFMNTWGKLFRGQVLDKDDIPIFDRTILKPKYPVRSLHHDEFSPPPLLLGQSDTVAEKQYETTPMSLHLTKTQVEILKRKANEVLDQTELRPYTSYEVIASHIWRSACKARQVSVDANQPTIVRMHASLRNRMNPAIPENYAGNAITVICTPVCVLHDIISNPLGYSARKIRGAVDTVTEERIRSAINVLTSNGSDAPQLPRAGGNKAYFFGNPNLVIGSVMKMRVYDADFGWGNPFYVGPTSLESDGRALVLPGNLGDGSVNIVLRLQTRHAESFKNFFFQEVMQEWRSSSTQDRNRSKI